MKEQQGMFVHPLVLTMLVAVIAVLMTVIVMNRPPALNNGDNRSINPVAMTAQASNLQLYQSTMHPWIVQDHPGTCPICGMELVKMSPTDQASYLANHPELT